MRERYVPPSEFLQSVADGEAPLSGNAFADTNLQLLIGFMRDEDRASRDWATFLLAHEEIDTPAVRDALMCAAQDDDQAVRAEAILGLAKRDRLLALPYVQEALRADSVAIPILDAAALCAHPSLIADLKVWAAPSDNPQADKLAIEALEACERSNPTTS